MTRESGKKRDLHHKTYFKRYAEPPLCNANDVPEPDMIITIPVYNEKFLLNTFKSLESCIPSESVILVLVLINASENDSREVIDTNENTWRSAISFIGYKSNNLHYRLFKINNLPSKHAGVGLARKILMDQAIRIYDFYKKTGPVICLDADCTVAPNYLITLEKKFLRDKWQAGIIKYEHRMKDEEGVDLTHAIVDYEMHLRYYVLAQMWAGFPYAHQTVGSCMVVKSDLYAKYGGMNKRKAGEDFYFLHKIIPEVDFKRINETTVYPSPRASLRVPFGTGRAVNEWLKNGASSTYNFNAFIDLKLSIDYFGQIIDNAYPFDLNRLPASMARFLSDCHIDEAWKRILISSRDSGMRRKNFYNWFNAFRLLKYVHFARDNYFPDENVEDETRKLIRQITGKEKVAGGLQLLVFLRDLEKNI